MGGAPVLEYVRDRVTLTPPAAASFRRVERELGRQMDVNRTYADYATQLRMFNAWNCYVAGRCPHPGHSRALHPDDSVHCRAEALDSDDWSTPGFVALMARHGWIRTAANDPTERHHFEYQWWRDQHRNDPAPTTPTTPTPDLEEIEMNPRQIHYLAPNNVVIRALFVPGTSWFVKWTEGNASTIANRFATGMPTTSSMEVTESVFNVFEREATAMRPRDALTIEMADATP